jgi:hypothetical protein
VSRPAYDYEPVGTGVEDITTTPDDTYVHRDARVFTLVRRLADEVTTLFTKELALLKVETTNAIRDVRAGIVSVAAGGAVLYAGFLFLLVSAFLALSLVMDGWLAALIVGGVVAIIGAIMLASGKKKLEASNFKPEHTQAAMQKDREMIRQNIDDTKATVHGHRDPHVRDRSTSLRESDTAIRAQEPSLAGRDPLAAGAAERAASTPSGTLGDGRTTSASDPARPTTLTDRDTIERNTDESHKR